MPTFNPYTDSHAIQKYQFLEHFLPHPEKKTRAKLLSHGTLTIYVLLLALVLSLFRVIPIVAPGVLGYASDINITELLNETNEIRIENGLKPLTLNSSLTAAAQSKASHMFANDYWAHVAPDGTEPWDFILGQRYDYIYAGENLAKNFNSSEEVVVAWFNSPTHKANLLSANYDEIGFAVVDGVLQGYETTLVVQMFGKPRNPVPVATVQQTQPPAPVSQPEPELTPVEVPEDVTTPIAVVQPVNAQEEVLPAVDVTTASKIITYTIGGFLFTLLALDIWYSKKKAIPKVTGYAYVHIVMLLLTIIGVWFALSPGSII